MLDLTPEQLAAVRAILAQRVPAREVRAFGSRVTGRAWRYSDLDLVVMGEAPVPALTLAHLRADFEDSDLPFRVDLVERRDLLADWPAAAGGETAVIQPAEGGAWMLGRVEAGGPVSVPHGRRARGIGIRPCARPQCRVHFRRGCKPC